ncbi:hypothetical protein D9M73_140160 [compost metagenome]
MDRIADLAASQRDGDVVGDLGCVAHQFQLVLDDVEHALAGLDAGGFFLIGEHDGDADVDGGVRADAQEVGMDRTLGDGVERHVLRQGANLLAIDFDHHDRIHEVTRHQEAHQRLFLDVDRLGILLVAVDYGGDAAFATKQTGGSLANLFARLGCELQLVAHCITPICVCVVFRPGLQG